MKGGIMDKTESQSWITDVYQEFWTKADELASKEVQKEGALKNEYRNRHLDAMVAMFIAMMEAPVPELGDDEDDDCDEDGIFDEVKCKDCPDYVDCQLRKIQQSKQN
jgi:hypothetical protein